MQRFDFINGLLVGRVYGGVGCDAFALFLSQTNLRPPKTFHGLEMINLVLHGRILGGDDHGGSQE
jgi:hypothetical protein